MTKESFLIYKSFYEPIKALSDEQIGRLFRSLFDYQISNTDCRDPDILMAFLFFKNQFVLDEKNSKTGKNHWNWKGGASSGNHLIRNSAIYKFWRVSVFERDNYTCQKCGKVGGCLNAHHIKPFSLYPELRFVISNGITLCKKCHILIHKKNVIKPIKY